MLKGHKDAFKGYLGNRLIINLAETDIKMEQIIVPCSLFTLNKPKGILLPLDRLSNINFLINFSAGEQMSIFPKMLNYSN